ncbi:MAG: InlB B-repeat-containing protein, partial [Paludibacteraceae bacterium]|nr:InlB B-repeat-containing protein [Paludibacteraceae bacterium]
MKKSSSLFPANARGGYRPAASHQNESCHLLSSCFCRRRADGEPTAEAAVKHPLTISGNHQSASVHRFTGSPVYRFCGSLPTVDRRSNYTLSTSCAPSRLTETPSSDFSSDFHRISEALVPKSSVSSSNLFSAEISSVHRNIVSSLNSKFKIHNLGVFHRLATLALILLLGIGQMWGQTSAAMGTYVLSSDTKPSSDTQFYKFGDGIYYWRNTGSSYDATYGLKMSTSSIKADFVLCATSSTELSITTGAEDAASSATFTAAVYKLTETEYGNFLNGTSKSTKVPHTGIPTNATALFEKKIVKPSQGSTTTIIGTINGSDKYYLVELSIDASASSVDFCTSLTLKTPSSSSTYSITYNLDGGTHGTNHPTSGTIGTAFAVSAPTKSGSTFTGWTVTSGLNTSTAKWGTSSSPSTSLTISTKCVNGTNDVYFKDLGSANTSVTLTANWESSSVAVTSVTLNKDATTIIRGSSETLTATVKPDNATDRAVTWSVSGNSKVTVDNGVVSVASDATVGSTATVTATAHDGSGKKATCTVTVGDIQYASTVDFDSYITDYSLSGETAVTSDSEPLKSNHYTLTNCSTSVLDASTKDGGVFHGLKLKNKTGATLSFYVRANDKVTITLGSVNGLELYIGDSKQSAVAGEHSYSSDAKYSIKTTGTGTNVIKKIEIGSATTYTVTLNPNGGTTSAEGWTLSDGKYTKSGIASSTEVALPTLTKSGYTFSKWTNAGGTEVTSPVTVTSNLTLNANWNCATPSFKTNLSTEEVAYTKDATATALTVEANESYSISYKWQKSSDNSSWSDISGETSASYTPSTATVGTTYYHCIMTNAVSGCSTSVTSNSAKITVNPKTYTITYDANGATSGSVPDATVGSGSVTLATNSGILAKTGYTFDGWNTATDGSGDSYAAGASYNLTADITLYAKWTQATPVGDKVYITFGTNDTCDIKSNTTETTVIDGISVNSQMELYNPAEGKLGGNKYVIFTCSSGFSAMSINARKGSITAEYYPNTDGTGTKSTESVTSSTTMSFSKVSGAKYIKLTRTSTDSPFIVYVCLTKAGGSTTTHTVTIAKNESGWGTVSESSVTVADGTSISADGATLTIGSTNITATHATATAEYTYGFANWSWTESLETVTKDITATANFTRTIRQYDVTFDLQGHGSAIAKQTIDYNGTVTKPTDPTATGYTFGDWYKEAACSNAWDFSTDIVQANCTLYAKWTAKQTNITLNANTEHHGSTGSSVTATYDAVLPDFTPCTPASGYSLDGYFTAATGGTKVINANGTLVASVSGYTDANSKWKKEDASLTLYAQYTAKPATGITITGDATEVEVGQTISFTASLEPSDCLETITWSSERDENATVESNNTSVTVTGVKPRDSKFKIYAKTSTLTDNSHFKEIKVFANITYDMTNGGTCSKESEKAYGEITLPTPTKDNAIFNGWFDAATSGTKKGDAGAKYTPTASITLYAQWTPAVRIAINLDDGELLNKAGWTQAASDAGYDYYKDLPANGAAYTIPQAADVQRTGKVLSSTTPWCDDHSPVYCYPPSEYSFTTNGFNYTFTAQWVDACSATAEAGENKSTTINTGVALAATPAASGFAGAWTIAGPSTDASQLSSPTSATATFTPTATGTYTLTWTVTNNNDVSCYASDNMTVTVTAAASSYTISFNHGVNGTGEIEDINKDAGQNVTLPLNMFSSSRDGYVQVGWATSDGGVKVYDMAGTYSADANVELFPAWATTTTYTATLDNSTGISALEDAGWTFTREGQIADDAQYVGYKEEFIAANITGCNNAVANSLCIAKNTSAYMKYDLGKGTSIKKLTITHQIGTSSAKSTNIKFLDENGNEITAHSSVLEKPKETSWTEHTQNFENLANVKYIQIFGCSNWVSINGFSVEYAGSTAPCTPTSISGANSVEVGKTIILTETSSVEGTWSVTEGGSYASIHTTTGVVTGKAAGSATITFTPTDNTTYCSSIKQITVTGEAPTHDYARSVDFMPIVKKTGTITDDGARIADTLRNYNYAISATDGLKFDDQQGLPDGGFGIESTSRTLSFWVEANRKVAITTGTIVGVGENKDRYATVSLYEENGDLISSEQITTSATKEYTTTQITEFRFTTQTITSSWNRIHQILIVDMNPKTVSFDTHGGTPTTIDPITEESFNAGIILPAAPPTKSGYIFDGWYTAATGGTFAGNAGATYHPIENCTLHAHWAQYAKEVDFHAIAIKIGSRIEDDKQVKDTLTKYNYFISDGANLTFDPTNNIGSNTSDGGLGIEGAGTLSFWVAANSDVTITLGTINGDYSAGQAEISLDGGKTWEYIAGCTSKTTSKSTSYSIESETQIQLKTSSKWSRIQQIDIETVAPTEITETYVWKKSSTSCSDASTSDNVTELADVTNSGGSYAENSSYNSTKTQNTVMSFVTKNDKIITGICFNGKVQDATYSYSFDGVNYTEADSKGTSSDVSYTFGLAGASDVDYTAIPANCTKFYIKNTGGTKGIWLRNMTFTLADAAAPIVTHTLTINPAGGTLTNTTGWTPAGDNYTRQVNSGEPFSLPAITKEGYALVNWTDGAGNTYTDQQLISGGISAATTFTANWAVLATGITITPDNIEVEIGGSDVQLHADLTPDGSATETILWSSEYSTLATVSNGLVHALKLQAEGNAFQIRANTERLTGSNYYAMVKTYYLVTFDAGDGGTCDTTSAKYYGGDNLVKLPTVTPLTDASFLGWFDDATGGKKVGNAGDHIALDTKTTLYAHYSAATYTIKFDGTERSDMTNISVSTATEITAPTRSGYDFIGWTVKSGLDATKAKFGDTNSSVTNEINECSDLIANSTPTSSVYVKNLGIGGATVTLTANWHKTCSGGGGSATPYSGDASTSSTHLQRLISNDGYTCTWSNITNNAVDITTQTEELGMYIPYSGKINFSQNSSNSITFKANNNAAPFVYIPVPDVNSAGNITVTFGSTSSGRYLVLLNENNDSIGKFDAGVGGNQTVAFTSSHLTPYNSKYYLKIRGLADKDVKKIVSFSVTLNAGGSGGTCHYVTYHANAADATGSTVDETAYHDGANTATIAACKYTREGYNFVEWNTDEEGKGDSYTAGQEEVEISADLVLYAIWAEEVKEPKQFALSGDYLDCFSIGDPATLTLDGSESGVTYVLYKDGEKTTTTEEGTGSAITFSITEEGTYTVRATRDTYDVPMIGSPEYSKYSVDITSNPEDKSVATGTQVTFSATARVTSAVASQYKYQWFSCDDKKYTDAQAEGSVEYMSSGTQTVSMTIRPDEAGTKYYFCRFTTPCEDTYNTAAAMLRATSSVTEFTWTLDGESTLTTALPQGGRHTVAVTSTSVAPSVELVDGCTDVTLGNITTNDKTTTVEILLGAEASNFSLKAFAPASGAYSALEQIQSFTTQACETGDAETLFEMHLTGYNSVVVNSTYGGSATVGMQDNHIEVGGKSYYKVQGQPTMTITLPSGVTLQAGDKIILNVAAPGPEKDAKWDFCKSGSSTSYGNITTRVPNTETFLTFTIPADNQLIGQSKLRIDSKSTENRFYGLTIERNGAASSNTDAIETHITWDAPATVTKTASAEPFTYAATHDDVSLGSLRYTSSDEEVATVDANGQVTIVGEGTTTISVQQVAFGCYAASNTLSYTLTVEGCEDSEPTIDITEGAQTKCPSEPVTFTASDYEQDATFQWYKGNSAITDATDDTYTTSDEGEFYVIATKTCGVESNHITITNKSSNPIVKHFADEFTVKGDGNYYYRIIQVEAGVTATITDDGDMADIELVKDANNIVYLQGAGHNVTNDHTVVISVSDACSGKAVTQDVTIHEIEIPQTAKPSIAWIAEGTKGAGFEEGVKADQSVNVALYKYLQEYYDVTACNDYSTTSEDALVAYYSQYDLIVMTDYPNSKTTDGNKVRYTDAIGLLIDHRPILSFEAFVAGCPNWGISTDPVNTSETQTDLTLLCNAGDIFGDKTDKFKAGNAITVTSITSGQGLQGFEPLDAPDFTMIGMITDNAVNYIACSERQARVEARMMVFGLNSNTMNYLTEDGKQMVHGFINYLLISDPARIPDCSVIFDGHSGEDSNWDNVNNWEGDMLPNQYATVRIDAPCVVNITDAKVGNLKVHRSTTDNTYNGSITIPATGALTIYKSLSRIEDSKYATLLPTEATDVIVQSTTDGNGALIIGAEEGT